eukprot:628704-Rhodomonas_salina.2
MGFVFGFVEVCCRLDFGTCKTGLNSPRDRTAIRVIDRCVGAAAVGRWQVQGRADLHGIHRRYGRERHARRPSDLELGAWLCVTASNVAVWV